MNRNAQSVLIFVKSIDAGTGTLTLSLANLHKYGPFNLSVVVLEKPSFRKVSMNAKFLHGKNFYPNYYSFGLFHVTNFIKELFWYRKQVNAMKSSLVVSLDVHCNLIAAISKTLFFKKKKLILVTNINIKDTIALKGSFLLQKILFWCIKTLYNKADELLFPSLQMQRDMRKQFGLNQNSHVVHYGLKKQQKKYIGKKTTFVSVGRLVEQKNFTSLIEAFALTQKEYAASSLIIVGDGPMRKELQQLIQAKKLQKFIQIVGWKENVSDWIGRADVFVLSSKREGFPFVLLHALSAGVPIISTNALYGPNEILDGGKYGILVPVGDTVALARSMKLLRADKKERKKYGKLSEKRASFYSEKRMLTEFANILTGTI